MTAIPLTALMQQREDAALGAAWRRCEAALPEGWSWEVVRRGVIAPGLNPHTGYAVGYTQHYEAIAWPSFYPLGEDDSPRAYGPTPTAALEALADRLEAGNG